MRTLSKMESRCNDRRPVHFVPWHGDSLGAVTLQVELRSVAVLERVLGALSSSVGSCLEVDSVAV